MHTKTVGDLTLNMDNLSYQSFNKMSDTEISRLFYGTIGSNACLSDIGWHLSFPKFVHALPTSDIRVSQMGLRRLESDDGAATIERYSITITMPFGCVRSTVETEHLESYINGSTFTSIKYTSAHFFPKWEM